MPSPSMATLAEWEQLATRYKTQWKKYLSKGMEAAVATVLQAKDAGGRRRRIGAIGGWRGGVRRRGLGWRLKSLGVTRHAKQRHGR